MSRLLVEEVNVAVTSTDTKNHSNFRVYPNPSNGNFNVELDHIPINAELLIHDELGREVHRWALNEQCPQIVLGDHEAGIYSVSLIASRERIGFAKLVIE